MSLIFIVLFFKKWLSIPIYLSSELFCTIKLSKLHAGMFYHTFWNILVKIWLFDSYTSGMSYIELLIVRTLLQIGLRYVFY